MNNNSVANKNIRNFHLAKILSGVVLMLIILSFCTIAYCRDETAPSGAISIDSTTYTMKNGKKAVPSRNVTLRILASDKGGSGVNRICILNEDSLNSISWISWTDSSLVATGVANTKTKSWTLTTGDGEKTIYLIVEDGDGNTTVVPTTSFRYTINYDLKGGSNGPAAGAKEVGKAYTISSTIPTKSNYDFMGWDTSSSGTTAVYKAGDKYYDNADLMLYAKWLAVYRISYTLNGGTVSTDNRTNYNVETESFTLNNPTKTGYEFEGWTGSNGTTPQTVVSIIKGSTGDKSFVANYSAKTYIVTFDKQGGSGGTDSIDVTYDSITSSISNPSRTYWTFKGYYDEISDGVKYYDETGACVKNWDKASDSTLYASWGDNVVGQYRLIAPSSGSFSSPGSSCTRVTNMVCKSCGGTIYYDDWFIAQCNVCGDKRKTHYVNSLWWCSRCVRYIQAGSFSTAELMTSRGLYNEDSSHKGDHTATTGSYSAN